MCGGFELISGADWTVWRSSDDGFGGIPRAERKVLRSSSGDGFEGVPMAERKALRSSLAFWEVVRFRPSSCEVKGILASCVAVGS